MTDAELMDRARRAAENSYSPYSKFRVGAAAMTPDGTVFTGANIENASYPMGLCAETIAVGHAASSGERRISVVAVACLDATEACYPCGKCRQIMREFGVQRVLVQDGGGDCVELGFDEILPHSFGPETLNTPSSATDG